MNHIPSSAYRIALLLVAGVLAGCGTPSARNFGGSWRPANAFPVRPTIIPLHAAYIYYAAPMDGTLKTMLARWARDTQRELAYLPGVDLTLYAGVAGVRTTDIDTAIAELNRLYAAQGVLITASARAIAVERTAREGDQVGQAPRPTPIRRRQPRPAFLP